MLITAILVTLVHAQEPAAAPVAGPPAGEALARLRAAGELPRLSERLRKAGVAEADVSGALDATRATGAEDSAAVLEGAARAAEEGAPIDNLGAFVKARHAEGLRGRALADAIHAEKERRRGAVGAHGKSGETHGKAAGARAQGSAGPNAGRDGDDKAHGEHGRKADKNGKGGKQ
jgi:hypothetical protein